MHLMRTCSDPSHEVHEVREGPSLQKQVDRRFEEGQMELQYGGRGYPVLETGTGTRNRLRGRLPEASGIAIGYSDRHQSHEARIGPLEYAYARGDHYGEDSLATLQEPTSRRGECCR